MALLGKISAVLTASTADFTRKIGLAKNDLAAFQKRVSGIQLNLNTRALDGTLTKLQKFKREVDELRRLRGLGVDLGFDPRRLTEQFKAFEEIGKPLTDVKNKIEGLSLSIQAELYPELEKVSSGFRNLYRDIETGVTTWDKSEKRVTALTASLSRLSRATAAAADFGRLSASLRQETAGASFFQPRAQESLQRSRALRDQAAQVPARFRSDAFADLADSADENAARIERQAARVIAIEARIARQGATPNLLNARSAAQDNLDNLTRRQEAINVGFQRQIRESRLASIISPEDVSAVDLFAARLESLSSQLRAIDSQQFQGLISNATAVVRQFNAGEVSAKKAKQAVDALAASLNSVNTGRNLENQTRSLLFTDAERRRQQIQSDFDRERNAGSRGAEQRRDVNLTRERLNNEIIPRTRNLQQQASESGDVDLQRRAERLTRLGRQINNELSKATRSANNGQVDAANRSIANANALLERQLRLEQQISQELDEINAARRQQDMFLEASGGRGELLSQGARDAAADISTARQFRGQIASGASRIAIQAEIDQVTTSVTRLQREIARVANSNLGSREKIAELDRLDNEIRQSTQNLARTVAQYSGGAFSEQQVAAAMRLARNTAGSISTRGAASAQLAIQQGLFAIDDLISSTGGLEYKLRAVGNNITQLGLLLGQSGVIPGLTATTGLFIGLATVLGGQAVSAIVRWYNEGKTAEDQTKALNDALARQKSLVEELAQAFESLGDSIARRAFSQSGQEARAFAKELEEIAKKQREVREDSVASLDAGVQRERAEQNRLRGDLESVSDPGRRVAIVRQLQASQERERQAAAAAVSRTVSGDEVAEAIRNAFQRQIDSLPSGRSTGVADRLAERANRVIESIDRGSSVDAIRTQRAALEGEIARLTPAAERGGPFGLSSVQSEELATLQSLLSSLELPLRQALDQLTVSILESSSGLSLGIEQAQGDVEDAIRRGVPAAADFQAGLDNTARQLDGAQKRLAEAQKITDQDDRTAAVRRAEAEINDLRLRQDAINEQAREVRLATGRGGARTEAALSALQGNERFANEYGRLTARLREAVDRETQARNSLQQATKENDQAAKAVARAELEAASAASDLAAAAAEAALEMEKTLSRIRKIGDDALRGSEQLADDAQRRFTQDPTDANRQARDSAEQQLIRDRERLARANNALDRSRSVAASSDPQILRINEELRRIQDERRQIGDIAAQDRTPEDARRAEELANREAQLQAEREQRLLSLTQAEREQQDAIAQEINARQRLIEQLEKERQFDEEVRRRRNPEGDALRGLDLFDNPAQRQARELEQEIANLNAAFDEIVRGILDANNGVVNADVQQQVEEARKQRDEAERNIIAERQRAAAPAIFGLADSVQNAVLQGPSRAALNVSDISTQEGARELNRLLRGEDSARDQNLVELQRQSQALDDLNAKVAALGARVGVA